MNEIPNITPLERSLNTKVIKVNKNTVTIDELKEAGEILRKGGLVAFPTETVYGLGADAFNGESLNQVFKVKGRPNDNPLICHISDITMLNRLAATIPEEAQLLIDKFWPGALTIIFQKQPNVPYEATGKLETVGVRMPSHPIANLLIAAANTPLAAPSANLSTKPSPTTAQHCITDLDGRVDMIIDGGEADIGVESTVVMFKSNQPIILRPGGVTLEQLQSVIPSTTLFSISGKADLAITQHPPTPGMKYRHYAPNAEVIVIKKQFDSIKLNALINKLNGENKRVAAISSFNVDNVVVSKIVNDSKQFAHVLFAYLRELDSIADVIIIEAIDENYEGLAVMNRVNKAAASFLD
ncbi:sua5 [Entamoeba marina]